MNTIRQILATVSLVTVLGCTTAPRIDREIGTIIKRLAHNYSGRIRPEGPVGGKDIAESDLAQGYLIVLRGGNLNVLDEPAVEEELKRRFGVETRSLCSCVGPASLFKFMDEYNSVVLPAIEKKYGRTFDELVFDTLNVPTVQDALRRETAKREKEQAEFTARLDEKYKQNVWPFFVKGAWNTAWDTYCRIGGGGSIKDFEDEYGKYLRTTDSGKNMTPYEMRVSSRFLHRFAVKRGNLFDLVSQMNTEIADRDRWTDEKLGEVVVHLPDERIALLKKIQEIHTWYMVPLREVMTHIEKRSGTQFNICSNRVEMLLQEKTLNGTPDPDLENQAEFEEMLQNTMFPSCEFRQANAAAVLHLVMESLRLANHTKSDEPSNLSFSPKDLRDDNVLEEQRDKTIQKWTSLGVTNVISLTVDKVSMLDAIKILSKLAEVDYQIQGDQITFKTKKGVLLSLEDSNIPQSNANNPRPSP